MTINATSVETGPYVGNGATASYPYDFKVLLATDIVVVETDTAGDSTTLVYGTDYSVTGVGNNGGGNVVRTAGALPSNYEWLISRSTPITQLADFPGQGAFTPESHEDAFDKVTSILQEQNKTDADLQDAIDNFEADPGPEGPPGPAIPGPAGTSGPAGETLEILSGIVYPPDTIGLLGQLYINVNTGDLYKRDTDDWVFLINLMGPAGTGGGGTSDHGSLAGLTDPDHPISAVQGLQSSLDALSALIGSTFADAPVIYRQASAPTGTIPTGGLWFDSDNGNRLYYYDSIQWVDVHEAQIDVAFQAAQEAIDAASNAQATADGKIETFVGTSAPVASGAGDIWMDTDDGNKLYRWSGTDWIAFQDQAIVTALNSASLAQATADGKIVTFYQPTAPATGIPGVGDLWVDTDDNNHPYRYNGATWTSIRDGNIAQTASDLLDLASDLAGIEATLDGVVNIFYQAEGPTAISNPELALGDLWVDSDDNQTYRWSGSTWVSIRDSGIAAAVQDSSNAIAIADQKVRIFYQDNSPDPLIVALDVGDLWIDTNDDNRRYRYNGAVWIAVNAILGPTELNIVRLSDITVELGEVSAGIFRGGQTDYATGTGFWLGLHASDGDTPKFSIGNATDFMTWDGDTLTVKGELVVGEYVSSDNIILSAPTLRSDAGPSGGWETYKSFRINKGGEVKLTFDVRASSITDVVTPCTYQVLRNSTVVASGGASSTSFSTKTHIISGVTALDKIHVQMKGGEVNSVEPTPSTIYIQNAYIKADVVLSPGGSVTLD